MIDQTMRLQKYLSQAGICSRRKGEELIKNGFIKVNGKIVTILGTKVDPRKDKIEVSNKLAKIKENYSYILLNKPKDIVTTCANVGEKTVLDLIKINKRVYPVGRLDKDTTGLLLLTDDGVVAYRLSHPKFEHEKEYIVETKDRITSEALRKISNGVKIFGEKTLPAKVYRLEPKKFKIILKEGRNRQIRRMVKKVGNEVESLKRIRISNLKIGDLEIGEWRYLSKTEIIELRNELGIND